MTHDVAIARLGRWPKMADPDPDSCCDDDDAHIETLCRHGGLQHTERVLRFPQTP
jgi:hypothetical protein